MNKLFHTLLAMLALGHAASAAQSTRPQAEHHLQLRSVAAADLLFQIRKKDSDFNHPALLPVTAEDVLAALDTAGIEEAIVISSAYLFSMPDLNPNAEYSLVMRENDYVAAQMAVAPDRLTGICSVNPLADFALDEIQRCAQRLGLKGLHLDFGNSDIDLRSSSQISTLAILFEFLEVLQFPVILHTRTRNSNYGSIDIKLFIDKVLSEAPTLDIQIAHFAGSGGYDEATDRAMAEFIEAFADGRLEPSNLQFDLAGVVVAPSANQTNQEQTRRLNEIEQLTLRLKQLDPQQVLFATGWKDNGLGSVDTESININTQNISRLLPLNEEELAILFQARSSLLD
ncbi:MAG: putative TIM-barrel fold metal-dependent hydrolase [Pseudohongiellaceae bacterium]|jgi:predicted TIM-barrel fold metal-dependent hydrolase